MSSKNDFSHYKHYKTQLDRRKRVLVSIPAVNNASNNFSCGFFLQVTKQNKITKLNKSEAFKFFVANAFLNFPLDNENIQQADAFQKIGEMLNHYEFYRIERTKESSFNFDEIKKIIIQKTRIS